MKKFLFSLALALSLGVVAPQTVAAKSKSKIEVTEIKHHDGYDEVTFNDGSYGFFFEDGVMKALCRLLSLSSSWWQW